jgi:NADH dehydrogenase
VRVQIALGDLAEPGSFRNALRGVDTVVHLAAAIRDQRRASIEELNAVATVRLLRAAERAGARRFVHFSALGVTEHSGPRFFRSKALAERAVAAAPLDATVLAPSIVYAPGDPWLTLLGRLSYLPVMPLPGRSRARYQPIAAADVAACTLAVLEGGPARVELAGPEILTHAEIVDCVLQALGRRRPLVRVPLPIVRAGLRSVEWLWRDAAFATWDEAQLLQVSMTTARGTADAEALGVTARPMREALA